MTEKNVKITDLLEQAKACLERHHELTVHIKDPQASITRSDQNDLDQIELDNLDICFGIGRLVVQALGLDHLAAKHYEIVEVGSALIDAEHADLRRRQKEEIASLDEQIAQAEGVNTTKRWKLVYRGFEIEKWGKGNCRYVLKAPDGRLVCHSLEKALDVADSLSTSELLDSEFQAELDALDAEKAKTTGGSENKKG